MDIIFGILCVVVGLFIVYVLGVQFYRLGQNLKDKFPILYRLYAIFWCFIGALALIGMLVGVKSCIDDYQYQKREEKVSLIFSKYSEIDEVKFRGSINEAKKEGFSDKQIYQEIKQSKKLKTAFEEFAKEGITDIEIGKFLNLDPSNDYISMAQRTANEAQYLSDDQLPQVIKQSEVGGQNISTPKEDQKTYFSSDIFISPDLQEKIGQADTFYLEQMIADAKNAGNSDSEIYALINETAKYNQIINGYKQLGNSDKMIAKKFSLEI